MNNLSTNVSYAKAIASESASRNHLDNTPSEGILEDMVMTANRIIEPLMAHFGVDKIDWTSFYRSLAVNHAIGGADSSQHTRGQAVDLYGKNGITNMDIFRWALVNLPYDQIILECPDSHGNPAWVHISYNKALSVQRKQALVAHRKEGGGFTYQNYVA